MSDEKLLDKIVLNQYPPPAHTSLSSPILESFLKNHNFHCDDVLLIANSTQSYPQGEIIKRMKRIRNHPNDVVSPQELDILMDYSLLISYYNDIYFSFSISHCHHILSPVDLYLQYISYHLFVML